MFLKPLPITRNDNRAKTMSKANPIQLQKYLKGVDYPAAKQDLLDRAKQEGADANVLSTLERLSDDEFETPADVSKAVGNLE
jgi:hypothetical protein